MQWRHEFDRDHPIRQGIGRDDHNRTIMLNAAAMAGTLLPLAAMLAVPAYVAWVVFGGLGLLLAPGLLLVLGIATPRMAPHRLMRFSGAMPLYRGDCPELYRRLAEIARRAGIATVPRLYRLPGAAPNAFTVGDRDDAAIAISDGLVATLKRDELTGVLAHEVAHIAANDIGLMRFGERLHGILSCFCTVGLVAVLLTLLTGGEVPFATVLVFAVAPTGMVLLQLVLSRAREFSADSAAARLTGDPMALAGALAKLERFDRWTLRRLFGRVVGLELPNCLRPHPPSEERIAALRNMTPAWERRIGTDLAIRG